MSKIEYFTSWKLADMKGKYVLNEETNDKGARIYYGFNSRGDALDWYAGHRGRPLYETITYPCKLFCDIDHQTNLDDVVRKVLERYPNAVPKIHSKGTNQVGTHIVFENTKADTPEDQRAAFKGCDVDTSVYGSNRCLRMAGSPKYGKPRKGIYTGDDWGLISIGTEVPETRNAPVKRASTEKEKRDMTTISRVFTDIFGEEIEVWGSDPEEVNFEIRVIGTCPKCKRIHESTTLRQFVKVSKANGKVWYRCPRNESSRPIFIGNVELQS